MRKGSEVIGKLVVAYDTGRRIARIQDLIFDENSNQLLGFLVEEGSWLSSARVIPFKHIHAIGTDAIVVPSEEAVVRAKKVPEIIKILRHNNVLKGTRIMTINGSDLGTMVDLYFDDETGVIEGYEVSGGLFADAYSGRSFVPAPHTLNIGEHVAFVPVETAYLMAEQVGGIRGAAQTASDKLQQTTEIAGRTLQEAAQTASLTLQETTESTIISLQEATRTAVALFANPTVAPVEQKAFLIGKVLDQDVTAPNGMLLAAQGQQVTPLAVEAAERLGVFDQLYLAAGGSLAELNLSLQNTAYAANERLQDVSRRVAASLTNSFVEPAEQKAFVIGKSVEQDVIAPDGTLVAASGQLVTWSIAQEAEHLGVLDQLYRTTGGSLTAALNRQLQDMTDIANRRFQEVSRSATASLTNNLVEPAQQKAFVIGKTVAFDITTLDNTVLVVQGQQVTPLVAEEAERRGVLDQLYRAAGGSLTVGLSQAATEILASRVVEQALGRRLQQVVRSEEGSIIGAPGQIVTEQVIERARIHHKEIELMNAVGLTTTEAVRVSTSNMLAQTGEQLREGAIQVRSSADGLFSTLKEAVDDIQERSAKAIEEHQIKRALGRPVTRVILDQQDNVILNVGELITHQAIECARKASVLDILLSSVYAKAPELSIEELRAPQRGEASLEERNQMALT